MKVLLFGATGMVGRGVLRECLLDADIEVVQTVGRSATGVKNAKLCEIVHANLFDCTAIEADLRGFDACFFCLGVTSAGKSEADYTAPDLRPDSGRRANARSPQYRDVAANDVRLCVRQRH